MNFSVRNTCSAMYRAAVFAYAAYNQHKAEKTRFRVIAIHPTSLLYPPNYL